MYDDYDDDIEVLKDAEYIFRFAKSKRPNVGLYDADDGELANTLTTTDTTTGNSLIDALGSNFFSSGCVKKDEVKSKISVSVGDLNGIHSMSLHEYTDMSYR